MLRLKDLEKSFGDKKVLSNINIELEKNEVVGLLGPNGAGKTTLMRMIVGFYGLKKGAIYWNKRKENNKTNAYKSRIGYLPENNPLYGSLTAVEYLTFISNLKGVNSEDVDVAVSEAIKECGLSKVCSQKIETLSKGYRQRVGLAAALIGEPEILILDEPTSGLDPNQIIEIRELIKKLSKNKVVLFSTHILPEAKAVCDRLLIINNGKIVLDEKTKSIKNLEKKFVELTA
ncbi:MAG: ABC transporter ATP-binding protein [Patescibacteria group bacterium]|jgi:ABC-2 type transport system ATP-binding protein